MSTRAQAAIEELLVFGVAILVSAVVIASLIQPAGLGSNTISTSLNSVQQSINNLVTQGNSNQQNSFLTQSKVGSQTANIIHFSDFDIVILNATVAPITDLNFGGSVYHAPLLPIGSQGTILIETPFDGNAPVDVNGMQYWYVFFDDGNFGWVPASNLSPAIVVPPTITNCSQGCLLNNQCYAWGNRNTAAGMYCAQSVGSNFLPQKSDGESCLHSFECSSDMCSVAGKCFSQVATVLGTGAHLKVYFGNVADNPIAPRIMNVTSVADGKNILVSGSPQTTYFIEAKNTLSDSSWVRIKSATTDVNGLLSFIDQNAAQYSMRLYRAGYESVLSQPIKQAIPIAPTLISDCSTLSKSNTAYKLTQDIVTSSSSCLILNADNIILDGGGHTIHYTGTLTSSYGIKAISRKNITIQNITVDGFYAEDIWFALTNNIVIQNSNFINNSNNLGISLNNVVNVSLNGITLSGNKVGINFLNGVSGNVLINNLHACGNTKWDFACNSSSVISGSGNYYSSTVAGCLIPHNDCSQDNPNRTTNGGAYFSTLDFNVTPNQTYLIQTRDTAGTMWNTISSMFSDVNGHIEYVDSNASLFPARSYRAVLYEQPIFVADYNGTKNAENTLQELQSKTIGEKFMPSSLPCGQNTQEKEWLSSPCAKQTNSCTWKKKCMEKLAEKPWKNYLKLLRTRRME